MRSVSKLIEEFALAGLGDGQKKEPDPEAIKANREEYCQKFMKERDSPIGWTCGTPWQNYYLCKSCLCEFMAAPSDAKYCPACGRTCIISSSEATDLGVRYKSVEDRLDELNQEKFSGYDLTSSDRKRYARRKPIFEMKWKELQRYKADVNKEISKRASVLTETLGFFFSFS